jgi:HTH-type transcriptional regulator/antitoxin HigA
MTAIVDKNIYGKLLMQTLPAVIKNDTELEEMTEQLYQLVSKGIRQDGLSHEEDKLVELLSKLIEDYEEEHYPIPDAPPYEVLKMLLEDRGMKQKDLIPVFGSAGVVSEILNGKRPITLKTAKKLAEFLGLSNYEILI